MAVNPIYEPSSPVYDFIDPELKPLVKPKLPPTPPDPRYYDVPPSIPPPRNLKTVTNPPEIPPPRKAVANKEKPSSKKKVEQLQTSFSNAMALPEVECYTVMNPATKAVEGITKPPRIPPPRKAVTEHMKQPSSEKEAKKLQTSFSNAMALPENECYTVMNSAGTLSRFSLPVTLPEDGEYVTIKS